MTNGLQAIHSSLSWLRRRYICQKDIAIIQITDQFSEQFQQAHGKIFSK